MLRIIKNFYRNPAHIREVAFKAEYELISSGNYLGRDTLDRMLMPAGLEEKINELFPGGHFKVICSRFRYAIDGDTHMNFVHADTAHKDSGWHILVYLSKESHGDGLVLYEHTEHGKNCTNNTDAFLQKDTENYERFIPWHFQPYEYNTAVVVDYNYFHSPKYHTGFGNCLQDSRLMHIIEVMDTRSPGYEERRSMERTRVTCQE